MTALWHDYLSVLLDPAHLMAEATFTVGFDLLLWPLVKWGVRRHDRKAHQ